jgi:hypothetical protein
MVGQSKREGNDRESWKCPAAGWKHRSAYDIEIVDTVDPAVGVDDAFLGILGHARGAEVVGHPPDLGIPSRSGPEPWIDLQPTQAQPREFGAEDVGRGAVGLHVKLREPPIQMNPALSKGVHRVGQRDAAIWIWCLLEKALEVDPMQRDHGSAEKPAIDARHDVPKVRCHPPNIMHKPVGKMTVPQARLKLAECDNAVRRRLLVILRPQTPIEQARLLLNCPGQADLSGWGAPGTNTCRLYGSARRWGASEVIAPSFPLG